MSEPRPSVHNPLTKSYAIDQITDIEHLRRVAHRMWEAFSASHQQTAHMVALHMGYEPCEACQLSMEGGEEDSCDRWQEWQRKVSAGFGSV